MLPESGLTGNQVRAFRVHLSEGQAVFGKRIAVSQAAVSRLEARGDDVIVSPETLLLQRIAEDVGYSFTVEA